MTSPMVMLGGVTVGLMIVMIFLVQQMDPKEIRKILRESESDASTASNANANANVGSKTNTPNPNKPAASSAKKRK